MSRWFFPLLILASFGWCSVAMGASDKPNLLLITVDDMNADSVGILGSDVAEITPNIDQLAQDGLRFEYAHVQVANCMPSRNVMWSGRYPHSNRVEGFFQNRAPDYPALADLAKQAGYFTAIRHKLKDSTPYTPYPWDLVLDNVPKGAKYDKKDAGSYGIATAEGIRNAKAAGKPFCILINIADPHRPYFGLDKKGEPIDDLFVPSRVYTAEEFAVPGYLVDDPVIRQELAHYYSSVRRADDAVGQVLQALDKSGEADNTLTLFLSDHGMAFPFAKTQLYHHSTRTPLIVRWPGVTKANAIDAQHMVSAVDILPTLLDSIGADTPKSFQGRSFLPLLKGESQRDRNWVFKEYNENSRGDRNPMRAIESQRFLYVFNPWSDGRRTMTSATSSTATHQRMLELAKENPPLADRMDFLEHRVLEEFYDIQNDPNALVNLIADPQYQPEITQLRNALEESMRDTNDPMLPTFLDRKNPQALKDYMLVQDLVTQSRRTMIRGFKKRKKTRDSE